MKGLGLVNAAEVYGKCVGCATYGQVYEWRMIGRVGQNGGSAVKDVNGLMLMIVTL